MKDVKRFVEKYGQSTSSFNIVNGAGCFDTYEEMTKFIKACAKAGASDYVIDTLFDAQSETDWTGYDCPDVSW